jgi:hypothetical protein
MRVHSYFDAWIPVKERVPDDRREVLVWGDMNYIFGAIKIKPRFLGVSRYNAGGHKAGLFDCDCGQRCYGVYSTVTHWAELPEGPR